MIRAYLPYFLQSVLWGDRRRHGTLANPYDEEWIKWQQQRYQNFYGQYLKKGVLGKVHALCYDVISRIDFKEKDVLEIGPGRIDHLQYMNTRPNHYSIMDVAPECLDIASRQLEQWGVSHSAILLSAEARWAFPVKPKSYDVVIAFNCLEHMTPLDKYLQSIDGLLKDRGVLVGSIPCEGGLAWGLGRMMTTRRHVKGTLGLDYDKLICWEHPNFCDHIDKELRNRFDMVFARNRPFSWLPMDVNLIRTFICTKHPGDSRSTDAP